MYRFDCLSFCQTQNASLKIWNIPISIIKISFTLLNYNNIIKMWSHCVVISNKPSNFASNKVFQTSTYTVRRPVSSCDFVKPGKKHAKKVLLKILFCLIVSVYKMANIHNKCKYDTFYSTNVPRYTIWGVVENDTMFGTFRKEVLLWCLSFLVFSLYLKKHPSMLKA